MGVPLVVVTTADCYAQKLLALKRSMDGPAWRQWVLLGKAEFDKRQTPSSKALAAGAAGEHRAIAPVTADAGDWSYGPTVGSELRAQASMPLPASAPVDASSLVRGPLGSFGLGRKASALCLLEATEYGDSWVDRYAQCRSCCSPRGCLCPAARRANGVVGCGYQRI